MAKVIKYGDTSTVEDSGFKQAPVGLYHAKVDSISERQSKNDEAMAEVVFVLTKDANGKKLKEKYGQLWYYAPLDPEASWARRLKDLVTAFGLKVKGGNLAAIEGKEAMVRLREDTDENGDYRPNIGKIMKVQEPDEEDEDEEDEDDEDEESEDGLDELSRAELKKLIKDKGLEVTVKKSMDDDDLREAIREEMEDEDADEEEEDDEEEDDDEEQEDSYDEMSIKALRQELKDRALDTKGSKEKMIARLRTDDAEEPV